MNPTSEHHTMISEALAAAGIANKVFSESWSEYKAILVDRTSMVRGFPTSGDEHASYERTLDLVRSLVGPTYYVCWGSRTDDYLGIEIYARPPV